MVYGSLKSRTFRRVFVRTPGGTTKISYKRRKPKKAHCAICGVVLKGVPREVPYRIKKLSKTQRRPERPYAGNLCSKCTRILIKRKARSQ